MVTILRMDTHGKMYREVRCYYVESDSIYCPTKNCIRHKGSYSLNIRGSDYCDSCGATMIPRKKYNIERVYS